MSWQLHLFQFWMNRGKKNHPSDVLSWRFKFNREKLLLDSCSFLLVLVLLLISLGLSSLAFVNMHGEAKKLLIKQQYEICSLGISCGSIRISHLKIFSHFKSYFSTYDNVLLSPINSTQTLLIVWVGVGWPLKICIHSS